MAISFKDLIPEWMKKNKEDLFDVDEKIVDTGTVQLNQTDDPESIEIESNNLTWGLSFDAQAKTIQELILLYRSACQQFEVDDAIDEIVNEAIVTGEGEIVEINLDGVDIPDNIKKKVIDEFESVLKMLDFKKKAQNIFRKWYVDGRIFFQNVVNKTKEKEGIIKLINISPLDIIRVKQVDPNDDTKKPVFLYKENDEYRNKKRHSIYKWSDDIGYEVPEEFITFVNSGITDPKGDYYISHIHKVLKPLNQLRLLEDSAVIYRISRAPERRVFYIDVGKLSKKKAEEYITKLMNKFRNKISYDAVSGNLTQKKEVLTMLEDFYLPTTSDQKGTKVDVLPSGQQLGEIDDIIYFKKKLYKSLKVPSNRMDEDDSPAVNFGQSGEITRQELKFTKYTRGLRAKFSEVFLDILKKQLILKKIIGKDDWKIIDEGYVLNWASDSHFTELKDSEIMSNRVELADSMEIYIGKYFSNEYIRKRIFKLTDDEIKKMDADIKKEKTSGEIPPPEEDDM